MIRIYPYPFSKHVKSLPDPPPGKSREVKSFECKKRENDYSWLLKARSNLKKCFHLCDICIQKFNYMKCLVRTSNVQYENNLNGNTVKGNSKDGKKGIVEYISTTHLCENNKIIKHEREMYDVKNMLKINSNTSKNRMGSNQSVISLKSLNNNSILFSNSLNYNESNPLSFNDDVFIFLDYYPGKRTTSHQKEDKNNDLKLQNVSLSKGDDLMTPPYEMDDMIIHIKRHLKNNVSYFACKHVKIDELHNVNDESTNYDSINIYMYDNGKECFSVYDSAINPCEEKGLFNLSQPLIITESSEKNEKKEYVPESGDFKNMCNNSYPYESLNKYNISKDIEQSDLNLEHISENCKLFNISHFYVNEKFDTINKESEKQNDKNCENSIKNKIIDKNINGVNNHDNMKNVNQKIEGYGDRIDNNCKNEAIFEKHALKKSNKHTQILIQGKTERTLIDELKEKLIKRKNSYIESHSKQNKNILDDALTQEEKEKMIPEQNIQYLETNSRDCSKETRKSSFTPVEGNLKTLHIYKKNNVRKEKTINNVNIDEFKRKIKNSVNLIPNSGGNSSNDFKALHIKAKNVNGKTTYSSGRELENNIRNRGICCLKHNIGTIANEKNKKDRNSRSFKKKHKGSKDDLYICNCDIGVKSFSIDEEEKYRNFKLLEQIKSNKFRGTNTGELNNKNENPCNSKGIYRKNTSISGINKVDIVKRSLKWFESEKKNIIHNKRISDNHNNGDKLSDINNDDELSDINNDDERKNNENSTILRNDEHNCLMKNHKPRLKNYKYSQLKDEFKEINYNSKKNSCRSNDGDLPISKKKECISSNMLDRDVPAFTNRNSEIWNNVNNSKDYLIKDKMYVKQNKGSHNESHKESNMCNKPNDSDKLKSSKEKNSQKCSDKDNSVLHREREIYGEHKEQNETCKSESKGRLLTNELKKKLSRILNSCSNPNKINIHNKIYAPDIEKINLDNNKIVYINNNYFFNLEKGNNFESCDGNVTRNSSMEYNFKKLDLQFSESKNGIYSFKYMNNVLSSRSSSLSKEYVFAENYGSKILDDKINKLNELRKKYLLKKYLNAILNRNKRSFVSNRINKTLYNIDLPKLCYNTENKKLDCKNVVREKNTDIKKKTFREGLCIKQILNEKLKVNKRDGRPYEAPQSPKKQDRIPKPLASQLDTNSALYLKKTPSYPFEEFNL